MLLHAGEKYNVIFFRHLSGSDPSWHQSRCFHSRSTPNSQTSEPLCLSLDSLSPKGDRWKKNTEPAARKLWSASSPVWPSSEAERVLTEKGGSDGELIGLENDHPVDVMYIESETRRTADISGANLSPQMHQSWDRSQGPIPCEPWLEFEFHLSTMVAAGRWSTSDIADAILLIETTPVLEREFSADKLISVQTLYYWGAQLRIRDIT